MTNKPPKNSCWATDENGTIQAVLFLTTLGAVIINSSNSVAFWIDVIKALISLMGVAVLIGYAYHIAHLSKKEIVVAVILATMFGLMANILPYLFVHLAKVQLLSLQSAVRLQ